MRTAIVVLPGGIKKNGTLPFFVRARLDKAYFIYQHSHPDYIIVTGKWDLSISEDQKITEAESMAAYLMRLGVPKEKLLIEKDSRDLISCLYHVKVNFFDPIKIQISYFICSDYQKERAEYVMHKVLGDTVQKHVIAVHSSLYPKVMWEFFTYERKSLLATKAFLQKMKPGNHDFLTHRFYNAPFYTSSVLENPQKIVFDNRLGKKSGINRHYSLYQVYKAKKYLFNEYNLTESKFHRGSKVDFWSGRFLPFVGRSENKTIHVLKFALMIKDKKTFENEIRVTTFLKSKGISFIPTIIASNTKKAPIWYLYKAMSGKIAGRFSLTFSFEEEFYREYSLKACIHHLAKLRSLETGSMKFPIWTSKKIKDHFQNYFKVIEKYDRKLAESPLLVQAKNYFLKNTAIFDSNPTYLSHSDLHPANILIAPRSNKVHFIDFEHVSKNNIAFDFCFLYVFSWDNKYFQQRLYSLFRKSLDISSRESFDQVFQPTYICFLVWLLSFILIWEGRAEKERFQKARAYVLGELKRLVK